MRSWAGTRGELMSGMCSKRSEMEGRGGALPRGTGLAAGASSCQVCGKREENRKEEATRCHKDLGWQPGRAHVRYVAKEKKIGRKRRRTTTRSVPGASSC